MLRTRGWGGRCLMIPPEAFSRRRHFLPGQTGPGVAGAAAATSAAFPFRGESWLCTGPRGPDLGTPRGSFWEPGGIWEEEALQGRSLGLFFLLPNSVSPAVQVHFQGRPGLALPSGLLAGSWSLGLCFLRCCLLFAPQEATPEAQGSAEAVVAPCQLLIACALLAPTYPTWCKKKQRD